MIVKKYQPDVVNVYAVKKDWFDVVDLDDSAPELRCYSCGHRFTANERISIGFVNSGDANIKLCSVCADYVIQESDVWEVKDEECCGGHSYGEVTKHNCQR